MRCWWLLLVCAACASEIGTDPDSTVDPPPPNSETAAGCAIACHGDENSNAPPKSISGATDTTSVAVGAHQVHLNPAPTWHHKVDCADCHVVPAAVGDPGHIDGDNKAEVTFSMRAGTSTWDGTTCTTKCHGSTVLGGVKPQPVWTQVDGTQSQCGSCHGAPPPAPHPTGAAAANCASCHPTMEQNSLTFRDPDKHINGTVDVADSSATGGCSSCHGSDANAAPPKDLAGGTARTSLGVGAHQEHLKTSNWRHAIACSACHVVPLTQDAPGHIDGDNKAEVKFDTMNPMGAYAAGGTCSTMYCHGNGRGNNGTIGWLTTGPLPCTGCHSTNGTGMSGRHAKHIQGEGMKCSQCHGTVVNAQMTIINADLHVNGKHEIKMANGTWNATNRTCSGTGCHGTKSW